MNKYIKMFMDDNNLKVGDEFKIKGYDLSGIWHFDENGYLLDTMNNTRSKVLGLFLQGEYEVEKVKKEPWKPEIGEKYYFTDNYGNVVCNIYNDDNADRYVLAHWLIFQTVEEARDYKWFLDKVDEYKKPFELNESNWFFLYDHDNKEFETMCFTSIQMQGIIYFGDGENINNFLEEVGEERIKKYWFNIWE